MLQKSSLFTVFLLIAILAGFLPISFISISSGEFHCVSHQKHVSLRWRHSVEKQLWYEHYRIENQQFLLFESWLQTFGAGTPSTAETTSSVPKGYIGYQHHLLLNELNWIVSPRMEGTILFDDQSLPLYQLLPEYSVVHFQIKQSPFWLYLLRNNCDAKSS